MAAEVDKTNHDLEQHSQPVKPKTQEWYKFWGNKCPVCQAVAIIETVKKG